MTTHPTGLITNRVAQLPVQAEKRHWSTYAKGEAKVRGMMNKTEAAFRDEIILPMVAAGLVTWWDYEAWTFKLTEMTPEGKPGIRYTPDFDVLHEGYFRVYEVKGSGPRRQDSLNRAKLLADKIPLRVFLATRRRQRDGGGFHIEEY